MNEYTSYILNKCLNDENEKELHDKIESLAQMNLLGLISVKSFIAEVESTLVDWNAKMLPKKDGEEALLEVMYLEYEMKSGTDFTPKREVLNRTPKDGKDNFFKHLAILLGVDFVGLSFQIFKHYKEIEKNGNK